MSVRLDFLSTSHPVKDQVLRAGSLREHSTDDIMLAAYHEGCVPLRSVGR